MDNDLPKSPVPDIGECGWSVYCHVRKALAEFAKWLMEGLDWIFANILQSVWNFFEMLFMGLVHRVAEPLFNNLAALTAGVPDSVWYFASFAELGFGVKAVLGALFIRFLIRRLPFVG